MSGDATSALKLTHSTIRSPRRLRSHCTARNRLIVRWRPTLGFTSDGFKLGRSVQNCGALIRRVSVENWLWGAPRIYGELLKLGFAVAQSTVRSELGHLPA